MPTCPRCPASASFGLPWAVADVTPVNRRNVPAKTLFAFSDTIVLGFDPSASATIRKLSVSL